MTLPRESWEVGRMGQGEECSDDQQKNLSPVVYMHVRIIYMYT